MRALFFLACTGCLAEFTQEDAQTFANNLDYATASGLSSRAAVAPLLPPPPLSSTVACADGGYSSVAGDVSGTLNQYGNGFISIGFVATFTDCTDGELTINGDPYLTATGGMSYSGGQMTSGSMTFGGSFRWDEPAGSGTCSVYLSLILASRTSAYTHLSGTVCGYQVDVYR